MAALRNRTFIWIIPFTAFQPLHPAQFRQFGYTMVTIFTHRQHAGSTANTRTASRLLIRWLVNPAQSYVEKPDMPEAPEGTLLSPVHGLKESSNRISAFCSNSPPIRRIDIRYCVCQVCVVSAYWSPEPNVDQRWIRAAGASMCLGTQNRLCPTIFQ
ncbi:hypothetical protein F4808DRAFT_221035 [Astrocystis sublimbata]|nr:hypothetical protein F4808DRAFT_221035 [Astrocystis sublimbata]